MPTDNFEILHATAVTVAGRGLLIRGASGSGKSGLALEMMARGATLVADDRVIVSLRDNTLWLAPPAPLTGMIEAQKDITLDEMVKRLADEASVRIGRSALSVWLRPHGWTFKKRLHTHWSRSGPIS